jgi:hypothetical protein
MTHDRTHFACTEAFLNRVLGHWSYLPESRFSLFAANSDIVSKIRKPVSLAAQPLGLLRAEELTRAEYVRGHIISPSHYLGWQRIPCLSDTAGCCGASLQLARLAEHTRLDHVSKVLPSRKIGTLFQRLMNYVEELLRNASAVLYSTFDSFDTGDERLLLLLSSLKPRSYRELAKLWRTHRQERRVLIEESRHRDLMGHVKAIHGDLTPSNIYVYGNRIVLLDPCVAYPDMYLVDEVADSAGLIVTATQLGFLSQSADLRTSIQSDANLSPELLNHHIVRIALIRLTIHVLYGGGESAEELRNLYRCVST